MYIFVFIVYILLEIFIFEICERDKSNASILFFEITFYYTLNIFRTFVATF